MRQVKLLNISRTIPDKTCMKLCIFLFFCIHSVIYASSLECDFPQGLKIKLNESENLGKKATDLYIEAHLFDENFEKWRKSRVYLPYYPVEYNDYKIYSFRDDREKINLDLSPSDIDVNSGLLIIQDGKAWIHGYFLRSGHLKKTLLWSNLKHSTPKEQISILNRTINVTAASDCSEV